MRLPSRTTSIQPPGKVPENNPRVAARHRLAVYSKKLIAAFNSTDFGCSAGGVISVIMTLTESSTVPSLACG
jgi:hypothetical protein